MIRFIFADLKRLWLGSLVVILLVALATALGIAVTLQERSLRLGSARAADKFDLVIGAAGSETQLVLSSVFLQASPLPLMPGDVLARLAADPRVAWAAPIGFGDSFRGYPIVGTTTALIANTAGGFAEGQMFDAEGEAVIGSAVTLAIGDEIKPMHGGPLSGGHTHTELAYRVTGKLQPTGTAWDRAILVPVQAVWHIHGLGEGADEHADHDHAEGAAGHDETGEPAVGTAEASHAGHEHDQHADAHAALDETFGAGTPGLPAILVKPKTIADAYRLRQEYRQGNTLAVFPGEVLTNLYATLGDAKRILIAVASGAQGLVAASLILVTVIHVGQRRRQIGALRAFGAPRLSVFAIVWSELFVLIAIGIGLGFLLGYAAAQVLSGLFTAESGITLPVSFARSDLATLGLLFGFAALLAALPAVLAYRQSPAGALRA
ncbi:ABC transporter permease [Metarhizobium album]|uniref:ABC transporter permease n=1 Tax=Metarhizobium album TaxID=2182425 RepID=A0A2U2DW19_9HYPH|nr:ABC transporter permease [Rhizobium album]PWE57507.1 ABC transporter permease [Rhizobium album]